MKGKLFKIINDPITLFVKNNPSGIKYSFVGFTIDGEKDTFYIEFENPDNKTNTEGRQIINLRSFLINKFMAIANEQLERYIAEHIESYDFYSRRELFGGGLFTFWDRAMDSAGKEITINKFGELELS